MKTDIKLSILDLKNGKKCLNQTFREIYLMIQNEKEVGYVPNQDLFGQISNDLFFL